MAFIPPQGNKTVMVDNSNNIVYPASFQKVVATQATIAGNNFTSVPSVIDPENASKTQLPSVASVVSYVSDVVEGGSSGLIPAIQDDIQILGQEKANIGEFYFKNNGILSTGSPIQINGAFTCIWTMTRGANVYGGSTSAQRKGWVYTSLYQTSGKGFCLAMDDTYMGFYFRYLNSNGEVAQISITKNQIQYFDGKPHTYAFIFDGANNVQLLIDNVQAFTGVVTDFVPFTTSHPLSITSPNQTCSRIKWFNFDMSADDAPYTIADYISGKDESPFLHIQSPSVNWRSVSTGTGAGNTFTFTTDTTSTSNIYPFYNQTFKGGVEYEFVFETQSSNPINIAFDKSTYVFDVNERIATNLDTNQTETLTTTGQYVKMCNGGHNRTIVRLKCQSDFSLFTQFITSTTNGSYIIVERNQAIGSLLSLDDYSIKVGATQIVPDVSSNNNDATITGAVYGSKDNSIAKMAQLFYQSQQG